jgi:hypothetical protein
MEKVLNDPATGITFGPFPKTTVPITHSYQCESPRIVADSTKTDSTAGDSVISAPEAIPSSGDENTSGTVHVIQEIVAIKPKTQVRIKHIS